MGASLAGGGRPGGGRRGRARKHAPMSEINVTPFVDVMLVLLIVFMVTAPLLTAGVPLELPESKGQQLQTNKEPLTISVDKAGRVFIGETEVRLEELAPKLKAIAKGGFDEQIFIRGDKGVEYGTVMRVMSRIKLGGFSKVSLITESEPS
ncbi:MAG: protein TolR [Hyphomicrobiaceae bacterium]|nr:protein TolR [Hyphomicrobiaceae bacterium]